MPTSRPRHMVTETDPVREALEELRALLDGDRLDFAELVILGAREKTRQLTGQAPHVRRARARLADAILAGETLVDVEAADAVKHAGLAG